jgi:hypothetical protein
VLRWITVSLTLSCNTQGTFTETIYIISCRSSCSVPNFNQTWEVSTAVSNGDINCHENPCCECLAVLCEQTDGQT